MHPNARLLSVATANPPHRISQHTAAAAAQQMFGDRYELFERMKPVFAAAGIAQRFSVRPIEWFLEPRGWSERSAAYLEGGLDLFANVARKALATADVRADEIDCVVTVSSTGIATPSFEARAMGVVGFRGDIERVPLFGLGCGGGTAGLAIAAKIARAAPGSTVLLVALELCTLSFRLDELTKANIIATALFGDGAAACVLRSGAHGGVAEVQSSAQHTWPDTLDVMGWRVDPEGLGVIFAQAIPPFAEAHLGPAVDDMLKRLDRARDDIDRFVCHPGGAKVVAALERALAIEAGALDHEREVLAECGNMSSPTVLFVLERLLRAGLPESSALLALGPGFSASCVLLGRTT